MSREPPSSEITPDALAKGRRSFLKGAAAFTATAGLGGTGLVLLSTRGQGAGAPAPLPAPEPLVSAVVRSPRYVVGDEQTPYESVTTYNNFYEFGLSKSAPSEESGTLKPEPWKVQIAGEVHKPQVLDVDDMRKRFSLEERVYRMRCVEAWSMVIPWLGFPLSQLVKHVEPTSRAKFVSFTTLFDPEQMPGQKRSVLDWPYVEALRMDEAVHPLTLMATGLYGRRLPNQNGAPLRLVTPWKYGFKGGKSIVRIDFLEKQPKTTWNVASSQEYGFYANVNPNASHPRWSQATERRIGEIGRRDTLMYNGYAEEVASLYKGMDLRLHF